MLSLMSSYSEMGLLTLVICSIYAVIGAYIVDLLLGPRAFGHFLNYLLCWIGAYAGNLAVSVLPLYFGNEAFQAVTGATFGMSVMFLNVAYFKRQ